MWGDSMHGFSILNKEDITSFKKIYLDLFNKSIDAGIPEDKRIDFIRQILDNIFYESINETIKKGYTFTEQEIQNMYNDFYKLIILLEKEHSNNYS